MKEKKNELEKAAESAMKHALVFLTGDKSQADSVSVVRGGDCLIKREIAVIVFCLGTIERSVLLATSYATAVNLAAMIQGDIPADYPEREMKLLMKDCLGECVNLLTSHIAPAWNETKGLKVSTPSIIFGNKLNINPETSSARDICLMTSAGIVEIVVTEYSAHN
ncbi:MAG: chemotaxis protein CheX [Spirochaetales bacterium]|nr:chemotaxis protein CheX [Spirochaetales bacterium]